MTEMTEDYSERTSINIYRLFFSLMAGIVSMGVFGLGRLLIDITWISELFEKIKGIERGFELGSIESMLSFTTIPGVIIAFFLPVICFIVYKTSREQYTHIKPTVLPTVGAQLGGAFSNASFKSLLVISLGSYGAYSLLMGLIVYYMKYYLGTYNNMVPAVSLILVVPILMLPFWTMLTRSIGKKLALIIPLCIWLSSQIGWAIIAPDTPEYYLYIVSILTGIGMSAQGIMPMAMLPDTVDQDEIGSGERRGGIYAGLIITAYTIGGALSLFIIGIILRSFGYSPHIEQSLVTIQAIRWTMCLGPMVFIIIALIGAIFYPITQKRYTEIRSELERLRAERAA
jgi:Na+/melibiose symporter-like transporter